MELHTFYLLIPIFLSLLIWRLIKGCKLNVAKPIPDAPADKIIFLLCVVLGTHIMCWFFKPGGRYTYLAFILTLILIYVFTLEVIKDNKSKKIKFFKLIDLFVKRHVDVGPKNLKEGLLSCWPIGYFPIAPATLASFVFAILGYSLNISYGWLFTLVLGTSLFLIGIFLCNSLEPKIYKKDPSWVVLDEASCQLMVSAFSGLNPFVHLLGFLLFRFFDISKVNTN